MVPLEQLLNPTPDPSVELGKEGGHKAPASMLGSLQGFRLGKRFGVEKSVVL
jgi:hypothetical protein